jgi:hypothetical protein
MVTLVFINVLIECPSPVCEPTYLTDGCKLAIRTFIYIPHILYRNRH